MQKCHSTVPSNGTLVAAPEWPGRTASVRWDSPGCDIHVPPCSPHLATWQLPRALASGTWAWRGECISSSPRGPEKSRPWGQDRHSEGHWRAGGGEVTGRADWDHRGATDGREVRAPLWGSESCVDRVRARVLGGQAGQAVRGLLDTHFAFLRPQPRQYCPQEPRPAASSAFPLLPVGRGTPEAEQPSVSVGRSRPL